MAKTYRWPRKTAHCPKTVSPPKITKLSKRRSVRHTFRHRPGISKALRGRLGHDDLSRYNAIQKLAYLTVIVDIVMLVLSGLAVWKSVQFPLLRTLMGGYDNALVVHFVCMSVLVAFFAVHVVMVALVPRSLLLMIRGR
jgi:thiosulfate reductase cytochrome b subunit